MQIKFKLENLYKAVQIVSSALNQRAPKPALQCIHIEPFEDDKVIISATDLSIAIRCITEIENTNIKKPVLIHGTRLLGILKDINEDDVELRFGEKTAEIIAGRSKFKLLTQNVEDYSELISFDKASFILDSKEAERLAKFTTFATSPEQGRYALNGVCINAKGKDVEFAATDGRRLAVAVGVAKKKISKELKNIIVPTKTLAEIRKIASEDKIVELAISDGQIVARSGNVILGGPLYEGNFPEYEKMIPPQVDNKLSINAANLNSAIRQAAQLTTEDSKAITFEIEENSLTVEGHSSTIGEASIGLDIEFSGEDIKVSFNPQFMMDVLTLFGNEEINIEINDSTKPAVISVDGFKYIIAPVRITSQE